MREVLIFSWIPSPPISILAGFIFYFFDILQNVIFTSAFFFPSAEDTLAELSEDATLELVWKNNERLKEYVLVSSKELEYEEDPGSLSETARAGHFTLEQCLNLFTKPEVLAPEEAW